MWGTPFLLGQPQDLVLVSFCWLSCKIFGSATSPGEEHSLARAEATLPSPALPRTGFLMSPHPPRSPWPLIVKVSLALGDVKLSNFSGFLHGAARLVGGFLWEMHGNWSTTGSRSIKAYLNDI